jgi:hypothetical protein
MAKKQPSPEKQAYDKAVQAAAVAWTEHDRLLGQASEKGLELRAALDSMQAQFATKTAEELKDDPDFKQACQQVHEIRKQMPGHQLKHSFKEFGAACQARRELHLSEGGTEDTMPHPKEVDADIRAAM